MFYKVSRIVALAIFAALIIIPSAIVVLGSTKTDAEVYNKPLALPTTAVVMAYTTIQSFRAFDLVYAMTQGGPNNSSSILVTLIYLTAFNEFRFGYAATQSIYLVIFILGLTALQRRILRTRY